jgi:hypothetical protein
MLRNRFRSVAVVIGAISLLVMAQASLVAANGSAKVLEWDTMVGVPAGLTGAQSQAPLRGINGGGVPWSLTSAKGELTTTGHLEIEVDGLVVASSGSNPSATFRALVSCVKSDGSFQNILTGPFPATTGPASAGGGDAKIETNVTLPTPCIAPIVFVTSAGGSWFASTGM